MTRLLRDRYLPCEHGQAWDLATGDLVSIDGHDRIEAPSSPRLCEVLDHGREAEPRWVVSDARSSAHAAVLVRRVAADATARGFVPIAVEVYRRFRDVLCDEIAGRTLLLIARGQAGRDASWALVDAAAASPRPHVLLTLRIAPGADATVVREARPPMPGGRLAARETGRSFRPTWLSR